MLSSQKSMNFLRISFPHELSIGKLFKMYRYTLYTINAVLMGMIDGSCPVGLCIENRNYSFVVFSSYSHYPQGYPQKKGGKTLRSRTFWGLLWIMLMSYPHYPQSYPQHQQDVITKVIPIDYKIISKRMLEKCNKIGIDSMKIQSSVPACPDEMEERYRLYHETPLQPMKPPNHGQDTITVI